MSDDEPQKDDLDDELSLAPPDNEAPLGLRPVSEETEVPLLDPMTEYLTGEPLTTEPLTIDAPTQVPLDEAPTSMEEEAPDDGKWEDFHLPSLVPLDLRGICSWPFTGGRALAITGAYFLTLVGLMGAWGIGQAPVIGIGLQAITLLGIAFLILPYTLHVTLASVAGATLPPPWPSYAPEETTVAEGGRMLLLLVGHLAPGILALPFFGWAASLTLLILGWLLFPGALLRFAGSGRLARAHPFGAMIVMGTGGARYLIAAMPGIFVILLRFLVGDLVVAPIVESMGFFALAWTGYMAGALARESEGVSKHLLKLAEDVEQLEEQERAFEEELLRKKEGASE